MTENPRAIFPAQNDYPTLSDRIQSLLIDQVFIIILMFSFAAILDRFQHPPDWIRAALFFGIWGIYEPFCISFACTIGNYCKNIRIRKFNDINAKPNLFQSYFRYALKILLGWLSFLSIGTNKERRAIHDLAANTIVIKANQPPH